MNYSYSTNDLMQEWATSELDVKEELEDEALRDAAILRKINEFYERNAQSSNVLTNFLKSLIFGIDEPREVRLNEVNAIVEYIVNIPCEHFQRSVEAREFTRLIETAIDEEWDYFQRGNGECKKFVAMRALPPIYYVPSVENENIKNNNNENSGNNIQSRKDTQVKQKEAEQPTRSNISTLYFYSREKIVFRVWYTDVAGCAASLCISLLTQLIADDAIVMIVSELQHCDHVEPWLHSSEQEYIAILRIRALNEYIYGHATLLSFHAVHQMICTNQDELAVVIERIDASVMTAPRFTPSLPNYLLPNFTHGQLTRRRANEAVSLWSLHEPFSLYIPTIECVHAEIHNKWKKKNDNAAAAAKSSSQNNTTTSTAEQAESEGVNTTSVMAVIVEMYFGVERCCPAAITSWQGKVKEELVTPPSVRASEVMESLTMALSSLLSSFAQSKQHLEQQQYYYEEKEHKEQHDNSKHKNSDVTKKQTISKYCWSESENVQLDIVISHIPREAKLCFTLVKAASEKQEAVQSMSASEVLQYIHEVKKKSSDANKQLIIPVGYVTLPLFDIHAEMQRGVHILHSWPWTTTDLLRFSTCHGNNNNSINKNHTYSTNAMSPLASTLANNSMTISNNYSFALSNTNKGNIDYNVSFGAPSTTSTPAMNTNTSTSRGNFALGKNELHRNYYNDHFDNSNVAEKMNNNNNNNNNSIVDDNDNDNDNGGNDNDKNTETFSITCVLPNYGKRVVFPSGRPPHVLRKTSEEAWHLREVKLSQHLKCDEVEQLRQLYRIFHYDALHDLSEDDKILLWKYREVLMDCPKALPWVLRAVNWMQPYDVYEMHILMHRWRELSPLDALQLLDARVADSVARSFATRCIDMMNDLVLRSCLLQLIQVVKIELYHYSAITRLLLRRAFTSPYVIAHNMFWFLVSEMDNATIRERFALILRELVMYCPLRRSWLRQMYVCKELIRAAIKVQKVNKRQRVHALHSFLSTVHLPHRFTLPLHPSMECSGLHINQCNVMDSKKFPLWLVFRNYHDAERSFTVIYKTGDDLRQDLLTLQLFELMDSIWKANGLDMHLTPYGCVSTGEEVGMIEVVLQSDTIANITRKDGGAQAAFDEYPLLNWLRLHNSTRRDVERCTMNFVHSTAGYIVASYILGIGDRHNDNIMIREDGTLFHIDFGHFLGNYKKKFGFKRETTPFVFTPMYLKVMGGSSSGVYRYFVSLALHAYNVMRHHGNLLIMLFLLMLPTGIAELQSEEDITYLRDALQMDKTDAVAKQHYRSLINESLNNKRTLINDYIHIRAH